MATNPKNKPVTLPAVHPNAGIHAAYKKKLEQLVHELSKSVTYWLLAEYKKQQPRAELAQDASPANELRDRLKKLRERWTEVFDKAAPLLAERFVNHAVRAVDTTMQSQLRKHDFAIDFKMTPEARNAVQAVLAENVALIRSIPQQYFTEVEGLVMRSIAVGGDLKTLSQQLHKRYGITKRRAGFIARDQNNKANAVMVRVRQDAIGVTHAMWVHSGGGKEPRPDHVEADGKRYEIAKGMNLDDGWVWPGQLPNCRCISRPILPDFR